MLISAYWKDGNYKGKIIERGSFPSSISELSKETNLSVMEIRTSLKHLQLTGEITSKSTNKFTIFTVVNYNLYQTDNKQDSKALRNGTYGAVEEFNKLPPLVRQAVGMPDNLKNWATADYQTIETVIQSNFLRTYEVVVKRANEINRMPDNIKSLIEKTNANSYKAQIEQKFQRDINTLPTKENALTGQNINAENYIEAPQDIQDRINRMRG